VQRPDRGMLRQDLSRRGHVVIGIAAEVLWPLVAGHGLGQRIDAASDIGGEDLRGYPPLGAEFAFAAERFDHSVGEETCARV
jgi:hypothetical protein